MKEILEHEFLMKEFLGHKLLTSMFLMFFSKKNLEHGVCIMNRKTSKTQGKLSFAPFPRISRLHVFLEKTVKEGKKKTILEHECPWRTNFPGERILGKPPRKNCGEKTSGKSQFVSMCWKSSGEKTRLENPNLFLCARKVLARKLPWKIPMCFYYVLEKFWGENPVGKKRQANLSNLFPPANSLGEASRHRNGLEARPQVKLRLPIHVNTFESPQLI